MSAITASGRQGPARPHRRGDDGLQERPDRDQTATSSKAVELLRARGEAQAAKRAGNEATEGTIQTLHPLGQDRRAGRGRLRDRLRRAQRRLRRLRPGSGAAHRGVADHAGGERGRGSGRGSSSARSGSRPSRPPTARRTSARRSSRASSTSGSMRSCCCARSTSTRRSTAARRSRSCARSSPRTRARTSSSGASRASPSAARTAAR